MWQSSKKTVERHWFPYRCTCVVCKNSLGTRTGAAFYSGLHLLSRLVAFRPLACSRQPCWFARAFIRWGNRGTFWFVARGKGGILLSSPLSAATMPLVVWEEWVRVQGKGPPKATDFGCHSVRRCRYEINCLQLEQATPRVCVCLFLIVVSLLLLFLSIITRLVFSKRMLTLPSFVWFHLPLLLWNRTRLHHKIASKMVV